MMAMVIANVFFANFTSSTGPTLEIGTDCCSIAKMAS